MKNSNSSEEFDKGFLARCDLLHSAKEVSLSVELLARQLNCDLADTKPLLLCVMNGGLVFTGQLLPMLSFPLQLDYLHATRYREAQNGADVQWLSRPSTALQGRVVVILDDILDEGFTLLEVRKFCLEQGAVAVKIAVMIEKDHRRNSAGVVADYVGLRVEDRYIFGMGMDYKGYWRNADGIYALKESSRESCGD